LVCWPRCLHDMRHPPKTAAPSHPPTQPPNRTHSHPHAPPARA
jgi:hypothetical protein